MQPTHGCCPCHLTNLELLTASLCCDAGQLSEKKRISLGTKPITLKSFRSNGVSHVFAASDRPTVIYSSNKKLLYSNLNEDEVSPPPANLPTKSLHDVQWNLLLLVYALSR